VAVDDVLIRRSVLMVCGAATAVIIPLIAAAWLPPGFPYLLRQSLLCIWGVGAILVAERTLFTDTLTTALRAVGFAPVHRRVLAAAFVASLPMWAFLPLAAWTNGVSVGLRSDWLLLLAGVVLVNGITEEVIHRGFVFRHLRRGRSFAAASTLSATLFAAQHLYIIVTSGWTIGLASVLLAALLSYPMALIFERGGNSIAGPAVLHTSSNAPVIVLAMPEDLMARLLVAHMGVILMSLCLVLLLERPREDERGPAYQKVTAPDT
jgi:membrane protease YdiL (CAAX protease family)